MAASIGSDNRYLTEKGRNTWSADRIGASHVTNPTNLHKVAKAREKGETRGIKGEGESQTTQGGGHDDAE